MISGIIGNWNKVVGMGTTLRSRLLKAREELTRQEEGLQEFTAAQEGEAPAWKEAVDAFEAGASTDNPYQLPHAGPTLRDVELELMHEEQERERRSSAALSASDDTLTEYLMLGLEIEGQHLLPDLLANKKPHSKELTDFVTRRTRVSRQIKKLRLMQRITTPLERCSVSPPLRIRREPVESERAPLFLPSGLSPAQARRRSLESLEAIRHGLTVKKRLQTYKTLHSRHQHQNTRSRSLVDNQQQKIDPGCPYISPGTRSASGTSLRRGECGWHALEKEDLQLPEDEEEAKRRKQRAMKGKRKEAGPGEREWRGNTEGAVGETMHDSVRVEWSKVYARVKRWREETRLLGRKKWRGCLLMLEWQAARWDERAVSTHYNGPDPPAVLRRCWWRLSDRVAPPQMGDSGQSSAEDVDGDEDRDEDEDEDEEGPVAQAHEEGGEEEEEAEGEDAERRRAEMDELLAIQNSSLEQYDDI
ncbi:hypothetical protein B0H14DRAFT_3472556 [Mycena olivaceomarginata]|nr:hypothetical protein B0H14DRAFT_3472556 [Mycena olivaceomarginata]